MAKKIIIGLKCLNCYSKFRREFEVPCEIWQRVTIASWVQAGENTLTCDFCTSKRLEIFSRKASDG